MHNDWHIISDVTDALPKNGEEVYCCVYGSPTGSDVYDRRDRVLRFVQSVPVRRTEDGK